MPEPSYKVTSRKPQGLIDLELFADRFEGARKTAGFKSQDALSAAIMDTWGVELPVSAIQKVERGLRLPSLEQLLAVTLTTKPDIGFEFFMRTLHPDVRSQWDTWIREPGRKP